MAPPYRMLLLVMMFLLKPPMRVPGSGSSPARSPVTIPLTRTLTFPVQELGSTDGIAKGSQKIALGIWPGAEDELPEGPTSFDVLSDGSLAIADPLLHRVLLYDAAGKYKRTWNLDFPADSVTSIHDNRWLLRDQKSGEVRVFDNEGKLHPDLHAELPVLPEASVDHGANRGSASLAGVSGPGAHPISIAYDQPRSALVAIEPLASDGDKGLFVALEVTTPDSTADGIDVRKFVRHYAPEGTLMSETAMLAADYFVPPVDELRIRNGVLYQLGTSRSQVRINEWDMNAK